jgi:hypothetical protein
VQITVQQHPPDLMQLASLGHDPEALQLLVLLSAQPDWASQAATDKAINQQYSEQHHAVHAGVIYCMAANALIESGPVSFMPTTNIIPWGACRDIIERQFIK